MLKIPKNAYGNPKAYEHVEEVLEFDDIDTSWKGKTIYNTDCEALWPAIGMLSSFSDLTTLGGSYEILDEKTTKNLKIFYG